MNGRLKVFLGMAAGVGKTYRMLQEGHAELEAGRDVVVGYLETHGRVATLTQAEGLEIVPRRSVEYRGTMLEEMDLPGILARAPGLCLIDELAHTNAPGVEHPKRFDDVRDVLAAGIDVYSTVNVQHLESLNDRVTELTGTRIRETVPDSFLGDADEVVLVDLTPEALIERLRAGKVYPGERVEAALNNFFRIEHLAALREVALRQVAEDVESKRRGREPAELPVGTREERLVERAAPQAVGERLLALVTPEPRSQRVVRRAWRSAQRLGADLDLLFVRTPGHQASAEERDAIEGLRRLASVLGAHLLIEDADDVADTALRVARERGSTYVLLGTPQVRGGLGRLRLPLHDHIIRGLPGVDVRIVADRSRPPPGGRMKVTHLIALAVGLAIGALIVLGVRRLRARRARLAPSPKRIVFPFAGRALSLPALDAALRLARAEGATLVPVFLATVPRHLPIDAALPRQVDIALPLLEAIELRASRNEVVVDGRIERGRTLRHALRQVTDHERCERIVVPAGRNGHDGFSPGDVAWLLAHADEEIVVLRPATVSVLTASPPPPATDGDAEAEAEAGLMPDPDGG